MEKVLDYMHQKSLNPFDLIMKYWQFVVIIGVFLIGYGKQQSDNSQLSLRVANAETSIVAANAGVAAANVANANVSGDIKEINGKLDLLINHSGLVYANGK